MGPGALAQVLRPLADLFSPEAYPDLLRGLAVPDDAAVYRLDAERALVLTADFFPPVVDDPYTYGSIAAANALSDLFAMGAEPLFGINLASFPDKLDPSILAEILRGGGDKVKEAGAVVAGGHTTTDDEPKYGLAVLGLVHPERVLRNEGAQAGDALLLTKPLGVGLVTTAHKRGDVDEALLQRAVENMQRLNQGAARLLSASTHAVHGCTDVTGFALLGHGHELAHGSGVALRIEWEALPLLEGVAALARESAPPGGTARNREHYGQFVTGAAADGGDWRSNLLYDPQTSGGLLVAVAADGVDALLSEFERAGEPVWRIGEVVAGERGTIEVVS